jgi:glycerol uptake facilitator-like aquaporin
MVVIPFTLAAGILFIGPLTGASFNVARTLGPAVVTNDFKFIAEYVVGILIGGAVAGLVHGLIFRMPK